MQKPPLNTHNDVSSRARGPNIGLAFINVHTLCMHAAKALCTGLSEPSLLDNATSTNIPCRNMPAQSPLRTVLACVLILYNFKWDRQIRIYCVPYPQGVALAP